MKHAIPHDLGFETAKLATTKAFAGYMERFADFNPSATWVTDTRAEVSFNAKGVTLTGAVEVLPNSIEIELEVPFIFRIFQGRAMSVIEGQIQQWVDKAKAGELEGPTP